MLMNNKKSFKKIKVISISINVLKKKYKICIYLRLAFIFELLLDNLLIIKIIYFLNIFNIYI